MPALDLALQIGGAQHGVVTIDDLSSHGCTSRQIRALVAKGLVRRTGARTLVVAGYPPTPHQRWLLAALDVGGVVSHASAAQLHGIGRWGQQAPVDVLVTRQRARRTRFLPEGVRLHSSTALPADDIDRVAGVPCTSVARTLLLLSGAPDGDGRRVRDLVDEAIRTGKASDRWLWWRLEALRRRGRPGVRHLESILTTRAAGTATESWLERQFLELVADHGLPLPRCQRRVEVQGAFLARVDFAYERQRLAIEVNGHAFHSDPAQLSRDANRRNQLQLAGYRVLDFTYDQIVRHPGDVADTVRAALQSATAVAHRS